jgi:pimeloyl-ACP methyl ester carboxylesterase
MADPHSLHEREVVSLYEAFAEGRIARREFMSRATALGIAGAASAALSPLATGVADAVSLAQSSLAQLSAAKTLPLDVAEWSYMWVNVKRADIARGSFIGGQQMYVEYLVPTRVRKPFPIVLVHGGGGQGTDWFSTPDGRPGWFQHLVAEGYKVYLVDRPGHGRSPQHPDLHLSIPERPRAIEDLQTQFSFPTADNPNPYRHKHTQWPGPHDPLSAECRQFNSGVGGAYVTPPAAVGGRGGDGAGGRGAALDLQGRGGGQPGRAGGARQPVPANQQPEGQPNNQHLEWQAAGAELVDKIGPAIFITHSAGASFGLFVAEVRPRLVKATVMIEGGGTGFSNGNRWGLSTIPATWDPPVEDPSDMKVRWVPSPEQDINGYFLQDEPARRLPHLRDVAVLTLTSEAAPLSPGNPGAPAFLKQAGVRVAEELRLLNVGVHGNSHGMMMEKNHREVLQPILDWLDKNVNVHGSAPSIRKRGTESTAMRLADFGHFWVGTEAIQKDYGHVVEGQMFVQYLIPEQIRQPFPIVLVHGGGGQMTHYMGIDGNAGWAQYYVQAGYKVYLIDRPGHGRAPVQTESLGPLGPLPMFAGTVAFFQRAVHGKPRRWMGTGLPGDPVLDQLVAGHNAAPTDNARMQRFWRRHGAELLDKLGPSIVQTHSAGGPFGFLVADERPNLVKALITFEGLAGPVLGPNNMPNSMPNYKGMLMMYLTAESSPVQDGPPIVAALRQSGALAEHINLKDRGITGNSHYAMLESNRKEVFEVIRGWIESKLPATEPTRQAARG